MTDPESWQPELEELSRREALAEEMGGDEKVSRQHGRGKLDVRQRIEKLVDAGSFHEIGKTAGSATYDEEATSSLSALPTLFSAEPRSIRGRW